MSKVPVLIFTAAALASAIPALAAPAAKHSGYHGGRASPAVNYGHRYTGARHYGGRYTGGRHYGSRPYYRSSHWGYWGVPLALGIGLGSYYYWDAPRYYTYAPRVIERVYIDEEPGYSTAPHEFGPAPEVEPAAAAPGAPTQRPLYLNYCADSKSYYPKVTTCASGWVMRSPSY